MSHPNPLYDPTEETEQRTKTMKDQLKFSEFLDSLIKEPSHE
jgi:hypothetical protein